MIQEGSRKILVFVDHSQSNYIDLAREVLKIEKEEESTQLQPDMRAVEYLKLRCLVSPPPEEENHLFQRLWSDLHSHQVFKDTYKPVMNGCYGVHMNDGSHDMQII